MAATMSGLVVVLLSLLSICDSVHGMKRWPGGSSTRYYDFKVQTKRVTKLCNSKDIVTINEMYPGPVIYAQEDDRVIIRVTNLTPYNASIHWYQPYSFLPSFAHHHLLLTHLGAGMAFDRGCRAGSTALLTSHSAPFKPARPSPTSSPWFSRRAPFSGMPMSPGSGQLSTAPSSCTRKSAFHTPSLFQLEKSILASGGGAPMADAYTINGHPGPNYNCSANDVYKIDVVPGKTYLLRLINAGMNTENFFGIAGHKLTIVEADAEYTKPFITDKVMLGPGQTVNVLVTANQPISKYSMAVGPYMSARNVPFQNITSVAYFQYLGATPNSLSLPALLPSFNDNLAVKTVMDGLRGLNTSMVPKEIDKNLFVTIGLNVQKCDRKNPKKNCQGPNGGVFAASMNNISFIRPNVSLLEAYYRDRYGYFSDDFPGSPLKFYDFVNGAPNNAPNDTNAMNGTRVFVLEYGTRVQLILQDTGTVSTENHPIHLHGYSFYVVGYGTGNYNPDSATLNLVDPPYMNTIGVPVGGWAAIRFTADNPGAWFMHCHLEIHLSWGLSVVFIVKNGQGPLETLPHPPADYPRC